MDFVFAPQNSSAALKNRKKAEILFQVRVIMTSMILVQSTACCCADRSTSTRPWRMAATAFVATPCQHPGNAAMPNATRNAMALPTGLFPFNGRNAAARQKLAFIMRRSELLASQ